MIVDTTLPDVSQLGGDILMGKVEGRIVVQLTR